MYRYHSFSVLQRLAVLRYVQKTLLLCYPDDFEKQEGLSLAAQCLQALQGDTVVHIGELFGDTASLDHAPWGRTTGAEAQQHLFSLFRFVLCPHISQ